MPLNRNTTIKFIPNVFFQKNMQNTKFQSSFFLPCFGYNHNILDLENLTDSEPLIQITLPG